MQSHHQASIQAAYTGSRTSFKYEAAGDVFRHAGPPHRNPRNCRSPTTGSPRSLRQQRDAPSSRDTFERKCLAAGFTPHVAHELNQAFPILKLVASGIAIGMVPAIAKVHNIKGVQFVPIRDKDWDVEMILGMVWRERTLPAAMKNFIDCVTEVTGARK